MSPRANKLLDLPQALAFLEAEVALKVRSTLLTPLELKDTELQVGRVEKTDAVLRRLGGVVEGEAPVLSTRDTGLGHRSNC